MAEPRYQDTPPEKIPKVQTPDGKGTVVVIAGQALGTKAYIETRSPIIYLDVQLGAGATFADAVPAEFNGFVYVYRGTAFFGANKDEASEGQFFKLGEGDSFQAEAGPDGEGRFLLIAGVPLREPVARYGPFVMNTQEEIMQAFKDYQSGKFGKEIEGSEDRYAKTTKAVSSQQKSGKYQRDQTDL